MIESISAITLATTDMARSVAFYESLGLRRLYGGSESSFTSFAVGSGYLNLTTEADPEGWWGRAIFYVSDVDAFHSRALAAGVEPAFAPRDAAWGERYFHVRDPDGHELSFARRIDGGRRGGS
jgi:catechol 2,3-dioxygenase-like lactoylglutathione lyase family enzyme